MRSDGLAGLERKVIDDSDLNTLRYASNVDEKVWKDNWSGPLRLLERSSKTKLFYFIIESSIAILTSHK